MSSISRTDGPRKASWHPGGVSNPPTCMQDCPINVVEATAANRAYQQQPHGHHRGEVDKEWQPVSEAGD
eukprot:362322-Chlamydomonas_euryale.AAC.5